MTKELVGKNVKAPSHPSIYPVINLHGANKTVLKTDWNWSYIVLNIGSLYLKIFCFAALDLNIEVNVEQPKPQVIPVPMPGYLRGKMLLLLRGVVRGGVGRWGWSWMASSKQMICSLSSCMLNECSRRVVVNSWVPETKIAEFANSVDLDEVAHY